MALLQQCSPQIDPVIAHAIVKTESSFNPWTIGVNRGAGVKQPKSYAQAVTTAKKLIAQGMNIDLGYAQINSANLNWLGLSVEQVFDPCQNLRAMQTVYNDCYARAGNQGLGNRIQRSFSCYNTGNMTKGFSNGYVNKATRHYNTFGYLLTATTNQPSNIQVANNPYNNLPKNGADLADFATKLQNTTQVKTEEVAKKINFKAVIDEQEVTSESDSSVSVRPTKVFNSWDIFKDF